MLHIGLTLELLVRMPTPIGYSTSVDSWARPDRDERSSRSVHGLVPPRTRPRTGWDTVVKSRKNKGQTKQSLGLFL
ncbi:MAG: hypothetical protein RR212_06815 [Bacteroidales bacterium]